MRYNNPRNIIRNLFLLKTKKINWKKSCLYSKKKNLVEAEAVHTELADAFPLEQHIFFQSIHNHSKKEL